VFEQMMKEGNTPDEIKQQFETFKQEFEKKQEEEKQKKRKAEMKKNAVEFNKLIRRRRPENDQLFFEKLEPDTQTQYIEELNKIKNISQVKTPYMIKLLESKIPLEFKAVAYKKLKTFEYMSSGNGEYFKLKQWIDTFMQIPFGINHTLPVSLKSNGVEACHSFMSTAKQTMDSSVYGMKDAKMQILQLIGQLMTNPSSVGTAIAIKGPMGTGKTTIVKEGISKVLGRPFVFIPLGGTSDSSYLEGHSYTYEGSVWGRIVESLIQCKCMNPVFYFDELDKLSETPRGEEIVGILTHLTDVTQNTQFHDKYFAGLDFDLSRALFIFSYNDEHKVNPILRDRMYCIETKGYEKKDKIVIARNYLIPKINDSVCFEKDQIIIPDETLETLIDNHTDNEKGVRNLKRCLETIYTKLNLFRLMPPGSKLFEDDVIIDVVFPFTVSTDVLGKIFKKGDEKQSFMSMYM
jgi:ATP-dependent Lon protease